MLTPISSGPRVSTAQYTSRRWPSGRRRCTRQMSLSVRSMVRIRLITVTARKARPTIPSWLALEANCIR